MLIGTTVGGGTGDLLGPIALLNFQGGAYVVAGVVALAMLAPLRYRKAGRRASGLTRPHASSRAQCVTTLEARRPPA